MYKRYKPGTVMPGETLLTKHGRATCPGCKGDITAESGLLIADVARRVNANEALPIIASAPCPHCGHPMVIRVRGAEQLSDAEKQQLERDFPGSLEENPVA